MTRKVAAALIMFALAAFAACGGNSGKPVSALSPESRIDEIPIPSIMVYTGVTSSAAGSLGHRGIVAQLNIDASGATAGRIASTWTSSIWSQPYASRMEFVIFDSGGGNSIECEKQGTTQPFTGPNPVLEAAGYDARGRWVSEEFHGLLNEATSYTTKYAYAKLEQATVRYCDGAASDLVKVVMVPDQVGLRIPMGTSENLLAICTDGSADNWRCLQETALDSVTYNLTANSITVPTAASTFLSGVAVTDGDRLLIRYISP